MFLSYLTPRKLCYCILSVITGNIPPPSVHSLVSLIVLWQIPVYGLNHQVEPLHSMKPSQNVFHWTAFTENLSTSLEGKDIRHPDENGSHPQDAKTSLFISLYDSSHLHQEQLHSAKDTAGISSADFILCRSVTDYPYPHISCGNKNPGLYFREMFISSHCLFKKCNWNDCFGEFKWIVLVFGLHSPLLRFKSSFFLSEIFISHFTLASFLQLTGVSCQSVSY